MTSTAVDTFLTPSACKRDSVNLTSLQTKGEGGGKGDPSWRGGEEGGERHTHTHTVARRYLP